MSKDPQVCGECGRPLKPLFTSLYCPHCAEKPKPTEIDLDNIWDEITLPDFKIIKVATQTATSLQSRWEAKYGTFKYWSYQILGPKALYDVFIHTDKNAINIHVADFDFHLHVPRFNAIGWYDIFATWWPI